MTEQDKLLIQACWDGDALVARRLLNEGACPNASIPKNKVNFLRDPAFSPTFGSGTVVEFAILKRYDQILMDLVKHGGRIQPHLVRNKNRELGMRLFIESGGEVTHRDYHWAAVNGHESVIRALEKRGVYSSVPIYDIEKLLSSMSSRQVLHWLGDYVGADDTILLEAERILRNVMWARSLVSGGLRSAAEWGNFPELVSYLELLRDIGAQKLVTLITQSRTKYLSLGASVDLAVETEFGEGASSEVIDQMREFLDELESQDCGAFEEELLGVSERYLLDHVNEFRSRKDGPDPE